MLYCCTSYKISVLLTSGFWLQASPRPPIRIWMHLLALFTWQVKQYFCIDIQGYIFNNYIDKKEALSFNAATVQYVFN